MASSRNLIINYVPQFLDEAHLMVLFSQVGPIESCRVMRDFKTGYSYGFGFINYMRPEDAKKAILQFNGFEIYNKRLKVSYARPRGYKIKDTNLYISNLPMNYTEQDLENVFGKFGKIVQKNLLLDKRSGLSRGVAFVRFENRDDAQKAIQELNGVMLDGCTAGGLKVRVAEEHGKSKCVQYAGWPMNMHMNLPYMGTHQYMNQQQMSNPYLRFPMSFGCFPKQEILMIRSCFRDGFGCFDP